MDINTLNKKVKKAEENVAKKESIVEKHKKNANKIMEKISKKGYNSNREFYLKIPYYERTKEDEEALDLAYDYDRKLEDIGNAERKLTDSKIILENWKEKLNKEIQKQTKIDKMPEVFNVLKQQLSEEWTKYDIQDREKMRKIKKRSRL